MSLWQKSSKLSRISSGEDDLEKDDLEKDGKDNNQKSSSEGGDPDNNIIQNTTDSKVGFKIFVRAQETVMHRNVTFF